MAAMLEVESPLISLVMGSDSDIDIVEKAADVLEDFGVPYDAHIKSAHRTSPEMMEYARGLSDSSVKAVIAFAGGSAHLPGMIASETHIPVLAVPVYRPERGHGDEARMSSIAMPPGIPLAVFPNNAGDRAALFAVRMLGLGDPILQSRYVESQVKMSREVKEKNSLLQVMGFRSFLGTWRAQQAAK